MNWVGWVQRGIKKENIKKAKTERNQKLVIDAEIYNWFLIYITFFIYIFLSKLREIVVIFPVKN